MRVIFSYKIVRGEQMMIDPDSAPAGSGPLDLDPQVLEALREGLPAVAEHTVAAVTAEVPEYSRSALSTDMASNIEGAVLMALATFLRVAEGRDAGPGAAARTSARGRLRPRQGRGPYRAHNGRPARRLPCRRARGVARPGGRNGATRRPRGHRGALR